MNLEDKCCLRLIQEQLGVSLAQQPVTYDYVMKSTDAIEQQLHACIPNST
jgi:hypothetical protein